MIVSKLDDQHSVLAGNGKHVGPGARVSARLTYLLKGGLVDLEDLYAEHQASVGSAGARWGVLYWWSTRLFPDRTAFGVGLSFLLIAAGQAVGSPLAGAGVELFTLPGVLITAPPSPGSRLAGTPRLLTHFDLLQTDGRERTC